jgi:DNA-binding transcriptional LysR family regulator
VSRSDTTDNTDHTAVGTELDIRSLRYFIAVAEELHFTRAAARLFVAQQALSRDIRSLERRLATPLFVRTTRRVSLTPEGERLLARARELVALHDQTLREIREPARPVIVDLVADERLTGIRVLELARTIEPGVEFRGHFGRGMGAAISALLGGEIDAAIGRAAWLGQQFPAQLERRLVRLEPLVLLMPEGHPLAARAVVPLAALEGVEIDANPAGWMLVGGIAVETQTHAPEWSDYVRQFLALTRARATPPHAAALSLDEQAHHLVRQGVPMLVCADHAPVPGGVTRPVVDPVPLFPWSIVSRPGANAVAVAALQSSAASLAEELGWLDAPANAWLSQPEASRPESR